MNQSLLFFNHHLDTQWKQSATIIAAGNRLDQLSGPCSVVVDDQNQMIYIADYDNDRVVEWRLDTNNARIVAGGYGQGNRLDQLNRPTNVIIDRQNNHLIIVDLGNRRVMRSSPQFNSSARTIIDNIDCLGLTMHKDGSLYVSDYKKNEIRRWKKGETQGTIVAGGNGRGNQPNQLDCPTFLFIDVDHTLYISDRDNHRVMKWVKDAKEGIVVAGGNGAGDRLTQLSHPEAVKLDQYGRIYVADCDNDRLVRWCEGVKEGRIVVGGNGEGQQKNQLSGPVGLSIDDEGNLYVANSGNDRIQKFNRDEN